LGEDRIDDQVYNPLPLNYSKSMQHSRSLLIV